MAEPPSAPVAVVELAPPPTAPTAEPRGDEEPPEAEPARRKPPPLDACVAALREPRSKDASRGEPGEDAYARALAHEKAGKLDAARKAYLELIQTTPSSPYVPLAYLAFAELFDREAERDPGKLAFAAQAYLQVTRHPPPGNPAAILAQHRLAHIRRREGDPARALAALKTTIELAARHPDLLCSRQLAERARADLVEVYALAGRPDRALAFFRAVSGDASGESSKAMEMLVGLAEAYARANRPGDAISALLSAPLKGAAAGFCSREQALMQRLGGASGATALQNEMAALAQAHGGRCAP